MQELEILLNSLIKKGWKPWRRAIDKAMVSSREKTGKDKDLFIGVNFSDGFGAYYSLRELTSLESGLWQFVCENSLIKQCKGTICKNPKSYWNAWSIQWEWWYWCDIVEYRLLESALIPEKELGKFLVENIKVEWNQISTPETK